MSYTLEIETRDRLTKIFNPRKTRVKNSFIRTFVEVMDDNGKWHTVGGCFLYGDAVSASFWIERAIKEKRKTIHLSHIY